MIPALDKHHDLDLSALAYAGPAPKDLNGYLFLGPHGLPFVVRIDAEGGVIAFRKPRIDTHMILDSVRVNFEMSTAACMKLTPAQLDALPEDPEARAKEVLATIIRWSKAKELKTIRGTLAEMRVLLQAWSSLKEIDFKVKTALTPGGKPQLCRLRSKSTFHADIPASILYWFKPVGSKPAASKRPWIDQRLRLTAGEFRPEVLSGHERIEAVAGLDAWLTAHYGDTGRHTHTIEEMRRDIGAC